jgi:hypothetical protein
MEDVTMAFLTVWWVHVMVGGGRGVVGPKELMGWVGSVTDGRDYSPPAPRFSELIEGDTVHRAPETLRHSRNFFFGYLVAISFPNRIDVFARLCTHFETTKCVMTLASVT